MKDVGQTVRENVSTLDSKKQIVLLGIANWTSIRNTHCLEREVVSIISFFCCFVVYLMIFLYYLVKFNSNK